MDFMTLQVACSPRTNQIFSALFPQHLLKTSMEQIIMRIVNDGYYCCNNHHRVISAFQGLISQYH